MSRYLTKSRFKLGLECPVKLYYTNKKNTYANKKQDDPFLAALAQGGFQVEELARLEYPDGILIEGDNGAYEELVQQTNALLQRDNVVIFEAAFLYENLFIRTDLLVKKGNQIELIEVKAKSYDPTNPNIFLGKTGKLKSGWKPYLFDVAFQEYVISKAFPEWSIRSFIMMADKSRPATINGLNQRFRIDRKNSNRTGITVKTTMDEMGTSVLTRTEVSDIVFDIQSDRHKYRGDLGFEESIQLFAEHYERDEKIYYPVDFSACKGCEFRRTDQDRSLKSGFEECWKEQMHWSDSDFLRPTTMGIWNFSGGSALLRDKGLIFLEDLTMNDMNVEPEPFRISASERRWIQVEKSIAANDEVYMLEDELREEMAGWKYPLHFIDFETSTVAIPFMIGMRPYEQVAFQFSHHCAFEDGRIAHYGEFLCHEAGEFPNFKFVRALMEQLGKDEGTIFRYSSHENSVLNAIRMQLLNSNEPDKDVLVAFIESITHSTGKSTVQWKGERDMVDLCVVYKDYYFDPHTNGSNSIKQVLPAVLRRSSFLQQKYSRSIGDIGLTSFNFPGEHVWLKMDGPNVKDPYKSLPPLLEDYDEEFVYAFYSEMDELNNGGAAMTAYGYLQYVDLTPEERQLLVKGLLRYCELDTLAMVMIYEHWQSILNGK